MGAAPGKALGKGPCRAFAGGSWEAPFGGFPGGLPGGAALGGGPWGRLSLGALPGKALGAAFAGLLQAACGRPLLGAAFPHGPPCLAFALGGCAGSHRAALVPAGLLLTGSGSHWAALVPTGLLGSFRAPMGFLVCSFSDLRGLVDVVYRRFGFIRWLAKIPLSFHGLPCLAFAFAFGRHRVCELGLARVM